MAITLRNTKGSELTFAELDGNFTHLDNRIDSTGDSSYIKSVVNTTYFESIVDSAYVNARVDAGNSLDSAEAIALIDSAYVQARQVDLQRDSAFVSNIILNTVDSSYILAIAPAQDFLDSAEAIALIDSAYVQARQVDLQRDSAFVTGIIDSAYIIARAPAQDFLDSAEAIALIDSDHIESRMKQVLLNPFTVASAPSTGTEGQLIYVTDGNAGDACLAIFSGGSFKVVSTIGSTILDSAGGGGGGF